MCQFAHLGVRYGDKCLDIGLLKHWGTNLCGVCIPQEGAAEGFFVSVSAILSCRPFFILIFLPCIKMNHYGFSRKSIWKTWKHFLEVLKVDYNCSLADVCRDQHTTLGGMSSWMSRRGYSVKQAKADVVRDYYGGVEPSRPTTSSPSFTQIAPVMLSEEEFSLSGITITFNSGTTISVKRATPGGIIKMLCDYERKEGDPCIL